VLEVLPFLFQRGEFLFLRKSDRSGDGLENPLVSDYPFLHTSVQGAPGLFWFAAIVELLQSIIRLFDRGPAEFVRDGREFWEAVRNEAPVVWFDDPARIALERAGEEAEVLHHAQVGTGHLVLGLLRESRGKAGQMLRELGIKASDVRQIVSRMLPLGANGAAPELSEGSQEVLRLALELQQRLEVEKIATEHLLLGLLEHGQGSGLAVLTELGYTPEALRAEARKLLVDSVGPLSV
jgi:hypothetical protein